MVGKTISLEDALLMTGFGKYNLAILALSGTILMGMIFETLGLSYIIPAAQCDLDLSLSHKGLLGAIPFIGIIASSHLWGWLADTRGRKPVMMWSMVVGSLCSIISSLSPDLLTFFIIRLVAAFFIAGPTGVAYAYLGEFNNPKYRDRMVTIGASFISVGCVILPGFAWLILPSNFQAPIEFLGIVYRPWRLLVAVLALPYVLCALCMIRAPESPKFLACIGKTKESMDVLRLMYSVNTGFNDDPFEHVQLTVSSSTETKKKSVFRSMWDQTVPLFQRPLLFFTCIACYVQFGNFACANGFYLWIPEILNKVLSQHVQQHNDVIGGTVCEIISNDSISQSQMNNFNASFPITLQCTDTVHTGTFAKTMIIGAIISPLMILSGLVVNILGKRNILIGVPLFSGLAAFAIHWSTNQHASLVLLGLFQAVGACVGMMNAVVVEIYPTHLRAMAVCLSLMIGRTGSILGSNLIGYLIEINCPSSFFLFGSILIVSSGVCLLLPTPEKSIIKLPL